MNNYNVPYVNNEQQAKQLDHKPISIDGDVKGYGSLTLEEQLELFADLIVAQLIRQQQP